MNDKSSDVNERALQNPKLFTFGIYPKCPFYEAVPVLIILLLVSLGTWGIFYFNSFIAFGYLIFSILFYFLIMPLTVCKYCYFSVSETVNELQTRNRGKKLLTVEAWSKSHLYKHVGQKYWTILMMIVWFSPIIFTILSFFSNFSIFALIPLISFIGVLIGNYFFMLYVKCPKCPIREQCRSSF